MVVVNNMFPRQHRLATKGALFVAKRGRTLQGAALRLKWVPARYPPSRATVVVGLAFDKRATRRNRTKRQVREILRPLLPRLREPVGLMVFVNKSAAEKSFEELKKEAEALLRNARLL